MFSIRRPPYTASCKTMSWGNYRHSQQLGVLHILYNQRHHVHRLLSIHDVFLRQFIQQLQERPIQGVQKIFRVILRLKTKSITNNVIEGGKEGEAMHTHEDYRNHPYQPPALTPDQQQQIEEDLPLMA